MVCKSLTRLKCSQLDCRVLRSDTSQEKIDESIDFWHVDLRSMSTRFALVTEMNTIFHQQIGFLKMRYQTKGIVE